jgi:gamma-glutamyltranspeptidase/glutathione hydrolase
LKGVVSAGDKLTAEAGAEILRNGGNAFDSAIASILTAHLTEPALTSLGGGGFLLAYEPNYEPVLYDFFVDVPPKRLENPDFYPIYVDFGDTVQEFHIGAGSIAVPGMVAGIFRVHQEKGKLPLKEIIKPAVNLARKGFYFSKTQASFIKLLEPIFSSTEESKKLYTKNGELIDENTVFKNEDYANFLEQFAEEGVLFFYEGEIADKIEKLSIENNGLIRKHDLQRYQVIERKPIDFNFKGFEILTNPPPSSGGILIAFSLELLSICKFCDFGTKKHLKNLIEALNITADFRKKYINENLHTEGLEKILFDEQVINSYKMEFQRKLNLWGNTTHISVIDKDGNAASVTTTNGEGSGYIIPKTGIMLNNMLGEEDLNPHGFFKWEPYIRLPSMMAPTIVLKEGKPYLILGSAGSNRIRSAIIQTILNYSLFNMDINSAVNSPRIHFENGNVFIEPGYSKEVVSEIKKHYKVVEFKEKNLFFGGVQAVTGSFEGAGDIRRGGYVVYV